MKLRKQCASVWWLGIIGLALLGAALGNPWWASRTDPITGVRVRRGVFQSCVQLSGAPDDNCTTFDIGALSREL